MYHSNSRSEVLTLEIGIELSQLVNEEHTLPYRLGISVGYCAYERGESLEAMMNRADEALYAEKRSKKVGR